MSERTRKFLPVLKRLRRMSDKDRKNYVRGCDKDFLDCVSECSKNLIKGNVPLKSVQKTILRRRKNDLRALAVKKTSLRQKRKILQRGGFLTALIPPIVAALSGLLFSRNASG